MQDFLAFSSRLLLGIGLCAFLTGTRGIHCWSSPMFPRPGGPLQLIVQDTGRISLRNSCPDWPSEHGGTPMPEIGKVVEHCGPDAAFLTRLVLVESRYRSWGLPANFLNGTAQRLYHVDLRHVSLQGWNEIPVGPNMTFLRVHLELDGDWERPHVREFSRILNQLQSSN